MHDAWHVESLRTEWWLAARLPVNWKLAMEAFMEGYHVMATHPQLLTGPPDPLAFAYREMPPEVSPMTHFLTVPTQAMPAEVGSREFIEMNIHFMRVLNEGMAGMTHRKDIEAAEALRRHAAAAGHCGSHRWSGGASSTMRSSSFTRRSTWTLAELNEVDAKGYATSVNFCFPHYFLLPTYGSASSYRIRPLGPEECLFELWSLTRFPEGEAPPPIKTPTPMQWNDPRWPPIPTQDFSNLPRQQRGCIPRGSSTCVCPIRSKA